jgi:hypothetical protein
MTGPRRITPAGERFGRLVLMRDRMPGEQMARARCDCGTEFEVRFSNLGRSSKSCGCSKRGAGNGRYRHGGADSRLYDVWCQIVARCHRPTHARFADYGARGITVCEAWRKDFAAFRDYLGEPPDNDRRWTVDRINNDGNYEPGNVRWATYTEQRHNRRDVA